MEIGVPGTEATHEEWRNYLAQEFTKLLRRYHGLEIERDRYKEALEKILSFNDSDYDVEIAQAALKKEGYD